MAMAAGGPNGGAKVVSLRLQYYCVFAAVGVAVIVLSLTFLSPSAMGAVRQNLGTVVAVATNSTSGDEAARVVGGGEAVAAAKAEPEKEKPKKAEPPVVLFNFGDSNSDTGGVAAAGGIHIMPPEGRTYFRRPTGRLSDGRVIIDFICASLKTHELNPYLKAVGSDYSNGVNFAMAGSTVSHGVSPYSLNVQVDQFVYFKRRSLELIELGLKGPVSKEGFENALYMMDIGHNDVAGVMHTPSDQWDKKLSDLCDEVRLRLKDATVVYTDMFAIKYGFVANHTKYGIEWPLMVCCGNGGPPYNFMPGKFGCGDLCGPEEKVLSWDGVHFTDFGSGLAAKHAMSGEYSKPRVKLASLLNGGSKKPSSVS
ncbi:unnamed protein product [Triticum turgidum subsp. durum]|uniref:Uncharacterized protein n=1 Tax=Triticum turgidum subsp. durum TaxID=4567 RepID=A0A9R0UVR9_TRITD|nr:unnamed protein product [Triticum turgidum subsp. durum]